MTVSLSHWKTVHKNTRHTSMGSYEPWFANLARSRLYRSRSIILSRYDNWRP